MPVILDPSHYPTSGSSHREFLTSAADIHREHCSTCREDPNHLPQCGVLLNKEVEAYKRALEERQRFSEAWDSKPTKSSQSEIEILLGCLLLVGFLCYKAIEGLAKTLEADAAARRQRRENLRATAPIFYRYLWHPSWPKRVKEVDRVAVLFLRIAEDLRWGFEEWVPVDAIRRKMENVTGRPAVSYNDQIRRLEKTGAVEVNSTGTHLRLCYGFYNQIPRGDWSDSNKAAILFASFFTKELGGFGSVRNPSIPDIVSNWKNDGLKPEDLLLLTREFDPPQKHPNRLARRDLPYVGSDPLWSAVRRSVYLSNILYVWIASARLWTLNTEAPVHIYALEQSLEQAGYQIEFGDIIQALGALHEIEVLIYDPAQLTLIPTCSW